ncbi:MAG: (2Fe-2S) ferredoxin domain-containing protein [Thiobacillaceae bacterium]
MPRPEKHVFVCSQARPSGHPRSSCTEKGCREVLDEFYFQFQQRQCFDKVAITATGCLGPCGSGPSVLVYPEGVMYGVVTKDDVTAIFEQHLLGGQPVERLKVPADLW